MKIKAPIDRQADFSIVVTSRLLTLGDLIEAVGLLPDASWSVGEEVPIGPGASKVASFNRWSICETAVGDEVDWESTIDLLFSRASVAKQALRSMARASVDVYFSINLTYNVGIFGFSMSSNQISFLSEIGASLVSSTVVENF